jgi:hypothetical protein
MPIDSSGLWWADDDEMMMLFSVNMSHNICLAVND